MSSYLLGTHWLLNREIIFSKYISEDYEIVLGTKRHHGNFNGLPKCKYLQNKCCNLKNSFVRKVDLFSFSSVSNCSVGTVLTSAEAPGSSIVYSTATKQLALLIQFFFLTSAFRNLSVNHVLIDQHLQSCTSLVSFYFIFSSFILFVVQIYLSIYHESIQYVAHSVYPNVTFPFHLFNLFFLLTSNHLISCVTSLLLTYKSLQNMLSEISVTWKDKYCMFSYLQAKNANFFKVEE